MIAFPKRCFRVADELISIQVGDECRVQPIAADKFAEWLDLFGQYAQQLSQSIRLKFDLGHARALAGKPEKLNVHSLLAQPLPIANAPRSQPSP